ncbi:MAG: DUF1640 domain-containing protein [Chloroflexi bacterium]|nr:DUF1640 domain-containing protein [Chloroflexota bacterium]
MAITIDTHAAIQDLEAAGADPKLAEAIVKTVSHADTGLVTKADLKVELHATIASLERRLIGYLVAAVVIVLAAIKYL